MFLISRNLNHPHVQFHQYHYAVQPEWIELVSITTGEVTLEENVNAVIHLYFRHKQTTWNTWDSETTHETHKYHILYSYSISFNFYSYFRFPAAN